MSSSLISHEEIEQNSALCFPVETEVDKSIVHELEQTALAVTGDQFLKLRGEMECIARTLDACTVADSNENIRLAYNLHSCCLYATLGRRCSRGPHKGLMLVEAVRLALEHLVQPHCGVAAFFHHCR